MLKDYPRLHAVCMVGNQVCKHTYHSMSACFVSVTKKAVTPVRRKATESTTVDDFLKNAANDDARTTPTFPDVSRVLRAWQPRGNLFFIPQRLLHRWTSVACAPSQISNLCFENLAATNFVM